MLFCVWNLSAQNSATVRVRGRDPSQKPPSRKSKCNYSHDIDKVFLCRSSDIKLIGVLCV